MKDEPRLPRRKTVILDIADPVLHEICHSEIEALHLPIWDAASAQTYDPESTVLIVDLDAPQGEGIEQGSFRIGITRRQHGIPKTLSESCNIILSRPVSIEALRTAVFTAQTEAPKYGSQGTETSSAHRRVTARRSASRSEPIPNPGGTAILFGSSVIPLTPGESVVFTALYRANGEAVTREALAALLHSESGSNLPDVHVCAIRKKLAPYGKDVLLHTVRNRGYVWLRSAERR